MCKVNFFQRQMPIGIQGLSSVILILNYSSLFTHNGRVLNYIITWQQRRFNFEEIFFKFTFINPNLVNF